MHPVIQSLVAEHRDLGRLVALLDREPALRADAFAPYVALLVDALFYLTRFPDVAHHAIEDRLADRLRARGAIDPDVCADIEHQHARLARQGRDLMRDLEGAMRGESVSGELVVANARLYAERLRHNMAFEELALFPAADALTDDDWRTVAAVAPREVRDPLFGASAEGRFADLHRAIAAEAGCGCDPQTP